MLFEQIVSPRCKRGLVKAYLTLIPTIRNNTVLRLIVFFAVSIYFLIDFTTRSKNIFMKGGIVHIFYILVLVYYYWRFCLFLKKMSTENVL